MKKTSVILAILLSALSAVSVAQSSTSDSTPSFKNQYSIGLGGFFSNDRMSGITLQNEYQLQFNKRFSVGAILELMSNSNGYNSSFMATTQESQSSFIPYSEYDHYLYESIFSFGTLFYYHPFKNQTIKPFLALGPFYNQYKKSGLWVYSNDTRSSINVSNFMDSSIDIGLRTGVDFIIFKKFTFGPRINFFLFHSSRGASLTFNGGLRF